MTDFRKVMPYNSELSPNDCEIRIASPDGHDIIIVGRQSNLVFEQHRNDNGSVQILITGITYYRSEDVPGDMVYTSANNDLFCKFQRSDGLYSY